MTIRYWDCPYEKTVEIDLSQKEIIEWRISDELGYRETGGSLLINWKGFVNPRTLVMIGFEFAYGIYPPVKNILNFDEVIEYLKTLDLQKRLLTYTKPKQGEKQTRRIG